MDLEVFVKLATVEKQISILKECLNLSWRDPGLLRQALTHSSYAHENRGQGLENNQRLEFLGDAVLELVISEFLYRKYPDWPEGKLTKLRASVVCEPSLARVARELGLGECLLIGHGEEQNGGRERPSILADVFEALLGAIYLDQGLDVCKEFIKKHLSGLIKAAVQGQFERDYKTELQEMLQKNSPDPVKYVIMKEEGPDHNKFFTAGVIYRGKLLGKGKGRSKKEAEQQAARYAINDLTT